MQLKHSFILQPRDLLFMRDARPMEASDAGLGANWPRPDQLWNALISAFHREWPGQQEWEGRGKHNFRDKRREEYKGISKDKNLDSSFRFGALRTIGPFPQRLDKLYLPMPLDYGMKLIKCEGTDLPSPLTHAFLPVKKGKEQARTWLESTAYQRYLANRPDPSDLSDPSDTDPLYAAERNIGIAIDPASGATVDGKLYQAEYLRLAQGVSLAFAAECEIKPRGGGVVTDVFEKLGNNRSIIIGGQQGVAHLEEAADAFKIPEAHITSRYLRWTLITPALFKAGWLPGWCCDSRKVPEKPLGTVMLRDAPPAMLIAARIGKPVAFSGWSITLNKENDNKELGPKPTQLAVPAGSCYVFDCGDVPTACALAALLHGRPRSDIFGEKGYGYGLCSTITL